MKNSREDNQEESLIPPVLPTYARAPIAIDHGEGVYAYDENGNRYLDFGCGIGVNNLGFCHPTLVKALTDQAGKVWHTSNIYRIPGQEKLADRLAQNSFADTMFFTNSGAEAVECAMKMARKYHHENGAPERYRIITFEGCFHGRTLATIAASGQEKLIKGFGPMMDAFDYVPFYRDMSRVEKAITHKTAAIMLEPVMGEGGIKPVSADNLQILRDICDKHGILLIMDEIQCGMGRTGKLFAHQHSEITPDILCAAKGIGGGFPLGACLATEKVGRCMTTGSHGSTYGGNPMAMAIGNAVLDVMLEDGFFDHVDQMSFELRKGLMTLRKKFPRIIELVRGVGLMLGLKLTVAPADFVAKAMEHGLLVVGAADNTVRILPPLIITQDQVEEALGKFETICAEIEKELPEPISDEE
ncbi:aspartate aminotransferase family protein [Paremcibacter congregatus]|uniref:Acetylornithine aminotransferase n=1 Tax=Paremcibacter congregatus TaxID=2043170 RepID=A0A2G4YUL1_9PROT|nr:aspartate aminotransferase family protein [Paremcibacter congregatus]PHZ85957.1 acetylornithine transaminase [Paremcibacter congregatus]QDE26922.1 aspartate aminotransferase family protein [Paremcibacter congregatus]|tara:strand:- start:5713 stop:6954 length:1242 start_codon:yes stop_codon:yes gene_type:complete